MRMDANHFDVLSSVRPSTACPIFDIFSKQEETSGRHITKTVNLHTKLLLFFVKFHFGQTSPTRFIPLVWPSEGSDVGNNPHPRYRYVLLRLRIGGRNDGIWC
jgi:hypothetical protein